MSRQQNSPADPILPGEIASFAPRVGIVLGSGLGVLADVIEDATTIPYAAIPGLPVSGVPGHAGRFVLGQFSGCKVILAQGRVHLYEGWTAREAATGVRLMAQAGIASLVLTNAAGSLDPDLAPGSWMLIRDHINLLGQSPLQGSPDFIDMADAYCPALRLVLQTAAGKAGLALREGVYAAVRGPQYETPAEVRMLRMLGADAVGMSTVPEVIQARALGIRVAALSCITNWAAGIHPDPIAHSAVSAVGAAAAKDLMPVLRAAIAEFAPLG